MRNAGDAVRVLYSFPHTLGKPGIGTTALHQVRELIALGVEVSVFCTSTAADLPGARRVVQTLAVGGRRVPHRALGVYRAYRYHDWRVARAVRRLGGDVDVLHAWPAGCLRSFRAASAVGARSFREVPSPHTASAFERAGAEAAALGLELPPGHSHRYEEWRLAAECAEYDAADALLVPSEYVARTFTERGYPAERLVRHRYGFDPAAFPAPSPSRHSGYEPGERTHGENGRPERPFTAVFAGRGEPNKGLHHALRAWLDSGAAAHGRFLVCGRVLPDYAEYLGALLEHPSVELRGFVTDMVEVMQEADVLVLPSVTEGSALVTFEATASGCVPVVSDAAGAPSRHLQDGMVHPAGDVAALTEHLSLLHCDRALLARLRANGLARRDELSWQAAGQALLDAYTEPQPS